MDVLRTYSQLSTRAVAAVSQQDTTIAPGGAGGCSFNGNFRVKTKKFSLEVSKSKAF